MRGGGFRRSVARTRVASQSSLPNAGPRSQFRCRFSSLCRQRCFGDMTRQGASPACWRLRHTACRSCFVLRLHCGPRASRPRGTGYEQFRTDVPRKRSRGRNVLRTKGLAAPPRIYETKELHPTNPVRSRLPGTAGCCVRQHGRSHGQVLCVGREGVAGSA